MGGSGTSNDDGDDDSTKTLEMEGCSPPPPPPADLPLPHCTSTSRSMRLFPVLAPPVNGSEEAVAARASEEARGAVEVTKGEGVDDSGKERKYDGEGNESWCLLVSPLSSAKDEDAIPLRGEGVTVCGVKAAGILVWVREMLLPPPPLPPRLVSTGVKGPDSLEVMEK